MDIDTLWRVERIGAPSLAPDGAQAVVTLTRHSMDDNKATSTLWLLSTLGGRPRALTHGGDKDGSPRFAPDGHRIAFLGQREQQGRKDESNQLYVIAADGGEARRVADIATGVEAFRWFPDARRIAFVSWVWPEEKSAKAQARRHKSHKERKETGIATSEAVYRYWDHHVPPGRVPHLHVIDVDAEAPQPRDLFAGTAYELTRAEPDADAFDVSPDGRRIVFAFDPAPAKRLDNCFALAEIDVRSGKVEVVAQDADWHFAAPRYGPDGKRIAFLASHRGRKHTMPMQLAVWDRATRSHEVVSAEWDHEVEAPLQWEDDGQALLFAAQQKGRRHLWRFDLPDRRAEVVVAGGWVHHFDKAAGVLVTAADAMLHPVRVHAHLPGAEPRRLETFNDRLLGGIDLGRVEEVWFDGASADGTARDPVQMWLVYPPGFDRKARHPLLHVIHGGPHACAGDTWHYRWSNPVFAAEGYVVAAVNYHGSSGFGYAFLDSITHRWGQLELADVEAATDWLLAQPWADRRRLYATGGSYGGYMVAWLNGHVPPGRYAAYVCHAGCFDWSAMVADDAYTWHVKELGAGYWEDMGKVHAQSPHAFAGRMHTPTLVTHGALDYRVPDAQGLAHYNTLKARGVDARLLWFPDENHWVLKPRNSRLWYREFFAWLRAHETAPAARKGRGSRKAA